MSDDRRRLPCIVLINWRQWRYRYGGDVAWSQWRARRRPGSYPPGNLNLNSRNSVLQHQTLMVEIFFVKRTIVKLLRLRRVRDCRWRAGRQKYLSLDRQRLEVSQDDNRS